ncbi:winged helix-turn-helix domain-containing protein [Candidatus Pelagibacter sp.]|jgi:hypothetical protein|nr:winged helix-turn-helix domain-containing protein [Candidatus Pelagibacter sp.]
MLNQNIHIINFKPLFYILEEIKTTLNFEIFHYSSQESFLEFADKNNLENSLILKEKNDILKPNTNINIKQIIDLPEKPQTIIKFIELLNIAFLKQKYSSQSNIDIKSYCLNFNSRVFSKNQKKLKLTQREIDIILFLNQNHISQSINTLQTKIWKYEPDLETHTVETHIYRLRKKIKETFNDDNFIISSEKGYLIE